MKLTATLRASAAVALITLLAGCQTPPPPPPPAPVAYSGPVLPIQQAERGVEIFLPAAALFETGKSALNVNESGPYLDRVAHLVTKRSEKAIVLEGHADNTGNDAVNQKLSDERAAAVAKALVERGVAAARIQTAGFSSRRPVASNATPDGRRLNRRVELVLLEEKVENLTKDEPPGAFASAWDQLKALIDQGLVKPVER